MSEDTASTRTVISDDNDNQQDLPPNICDVHCHLPSADGSPQPSAPTVSMPISSQRLRSFQFSMRAISIPVSSQPSPSPFNTSAIPSHLNPPALHCTDHKADVRIGISDHWAKHLRGALRHRLHQHPYPSFHQRPWPSRQCLLPPCRCLPTIFCYAARYFKQSVYYPRICSFTGCTKRTPTVTARMVTFAWSPHSAVFEQRTRVLPSSSQAAL